MQKLKMPNVRIKTVNGELLSVKELAFTLKRSTNYVYHMKRMGFLMPGGRTTLELALSWLSRNAAPRSRKT
jgi:hypothetical protein